MQSIKKPYPINEKGIKQMGVEQWQKDFYMPITGKGFQEIYEQIMQKYLLCFCQQNTSEHLYWTAVANLRIVHLFAHYIFHIQRLTKLEQLGFKTVLAEKETDIKETRKTLQVKHPILNLDRQISWLLQKQQWLKTRRAITKVEKQIRSSNTVGFCLGGRSLEIDYYCNLYDQNPARFFIEAFKPTFLWPFRDSTESIAEFIQGLRALFPTLNVIEIQQLQDEIQRTFKFTYNYLKYNIRVAAKTNAPHCLASRLGHPFNRTLCAAWQMAGKKVIGFPHGHTYATCYDQIHIDSDGLSIVTEQFASTKGQGALLTALSKDHNRNLKMAQVTYPEKSIYPPIFENLQKTPPSKTIKSVMIVGFPISNIFYPSFPSHNDFTNIDLELNLLHLLKQNNYAVYYKAHPDKLEEMNGIFDSADKIISDPFEAVYQMADCILFSYSRTSTFGYAMLTPKPIVLINLNDVLWHPEPLQLIKKRCRVVNAKTSDIGRVQFDDNEVLEAITSASEFSNDVIHQYAF